jgi:hypothetical protein
MEAWCRGGDGFNIMPPVLPPPLDDFIAEVVPLLQRRGAIPHDYEGVTLRAHNGLGDRASQART